MLIGVFVPQVVMARTIHVAKSGSDANSGSETSPYLTINYAAQQAQPGDTVIVHEGVYREHVNPARGGTGEDARITYKAAEGEQAVIKGSERITNWVQETDPAFESGVWKIELDVNNFFPGTNPYTTLATTQYAVSGLNSHMGDVYINGKGLIEHKDSDDGVTASAHEIQEDQWFTSTRKGTTTIWAHFGSLNPNEELAEINVREVVFFPSAINVDYITVSGFTMMHAADPPVSDTFEAPGLIGPHGGRSWIIENNDISYGRRRGISLGESEPEKSNSAYDTFGHHIIRNNVITKCGMNGIHGFTYCYKSVIDRNIIEEINYRNEFVEWTTSAIKLLGSQDIIISRNIVRKNGKGRANYGVWLDNALQNVRITGNLFEMENKAIEVEICHGPVLIDNNILIHKNNKGKNKDLKFRAGSGIITAHNLLINTTMSATMAGSRSANIWEPHTMIKVGTQAFNYTPLHRTLNNLSINDGLAYNFDPDEVDGNVLLGATATYEDIYDLYLPSFEANYSFNAENDGLRVNFNAPAEMLNDFTSMVSSDSAGEVPITNMRMENWDGSDLFVDQDILGEARDTESPTPGPFENVQAGANSFFIPYFDDNTSAQITSTDLNNGSLNTAYTAGIQLSGGNGKLSWSIPVGSLPPGLILDNGVIYGTPTVEGSFSFTVKVTDFDKDTAEQSFTLVIGDGVPAPTYALTVNSGSGDGDYTEGTVVTLNADPAPSGQVFDAWTGDVATVTNINSANTTLTMPAAPAVITASYVTYTPTTWIDSLSITNVSGFDNLTEDFVIDIAETGTAALNIRANASPSGDFGSVIFELSGATAATKTENKPAWELFFNNLPGGQFALGEHSLTMTPYDTSGVAGAALTINISVIDSAAEAYDTWISGFPSLTGDDAMPDAHPNNALFSNLENFAFGGDPTNPSDDYGIRPVFKVKPTGGVGMMFELTFRRRIDPAAYGLSYTLMESPDLSPGSWSPRDISGANTSAIDDEIQEVVVEIGITIETPKCFFRLDVSQE